MAHDPDIPPMEDHTAHLELAFVEEFIRRAGYDPAHLGALPAAQRGDLLKHASTYAASRLAEVEARAHYVHDIHGDR